MQVRVSHLPTQYPDQLRCRKADVICGRLGLGTGIQRTEQQVGRKQERQPTPSVGALGLIASLAGTRIGEGTIAQAYTASSRLKIFFGDLLQVAGQRYAYEVGRPAVRAGCEPGV